VRTLALYVAAGAVYVAIGVAVPDFLYSSVVGIAYVVAVCWALPEGIRRLRARSGPGRPT
jgi:hypothetical protein